MADFNLELPHILQGEGGYVNDPDDKGGETYCGISRANYPDWEGWAIIDTLDLKYNEVSDDPNIKSLVYSFYKKQKWDDDKLDLVNDEKVAEYFCDWHVTSGGANKQLQKLVGVTPDGIVGSGTIAAVNAYQGDLLTALRDARIAYYDEIGTGTNAKYLTGWVNRANNLYNSLTA